MLARRHRARARSIGHDRGAADRRHRSTARRWTETRPARHQPGWLFGYLPIDHDGAPSQCKGEISVDACGCGATGRRRAGVVGPKPSPRSAATAGGEGVIRNLDYAAFQRSRVARRRIALRPRRCRRAGRPACARCAPRITAGRVRRRAHACAAAACITGRFDSDPSRQNGRRSRSRVVPERRTSSTAHR